MDNIYTCICGAEDHWTIYNDKIKCRICGREYDLSEREYGLSHRLNLNASKFNEIRKDLCTKEPELKYGR